MGPGIDLEGYELRLLTPDDAPLLARHANDPLVARNLRDRFPHPYEPAHAEEFIAMVLAGDGEQAWAIAHRGEPVGVVGVVPGVDVCAGSWEIGYWLGREHWGGGVATAAVVAVTEHVFRVEGARRIWAGVFSGNPSSVRVLEKAGYILEGVHRAHVIKAGKVRDELIYARLQPTSSGTR